MTDRPAPAALDRIFIRDLAIRCIVGVDEQERQAEQEILVHLTIHADLRRAGRTDALEDTVDYRALKQRILQLAQASRFRLIEALAERIADECLTDRRIERIEVAVEKPGALRFARTVGVEIARSRTTGPKERGARTTPRPSLPRSRPRVRTRGTDRS
jgi:FolB domain-containing protein